MTAARKAAMRQTQSGTSRSTQARHSANTAEYAAAFPRDMVTSEVSGAEQEVFGRRKHSAMRQTRLAAPAGRVADMNSPTDILYLS